MSSGDLADLAVKMAEELGPVFPCAGDKSPLTAHGFKDASSDPDKIYSAFFPPHRTPRSSASPQARSSRSILTARTGRTVSAGPLLAELPLTRTQATPSGGEHRLYRLPPGRRLAWFAERLVRRDRYSRRRRLHRDRTRATGGLNDEDIATLTEAQCELLIAASQAADAAGGRLREDIAGIDHGQLA